MIPIRRESPTGSTATTAPTPSTWPVTIWPPGSSPTLSARSRLSPLPSAHRPRRGPALSLGRDVDREPAIAFVDDGEADARAGDRRAEIDAGHVVAAGDPDAQVAARLDGLDPADIGDDPGGHQRMRS